MNTKNTSKTNIVGCTECVHKSVSTSCDCVSYTWSMKTYNSIVSKKECVMDLITEANEFSVYVVFCVHCVIVDSV